jgi:hypothetical protein
MTAIGILAALMFGFTGAALWAIQDTVTFPPGPKQGMMVIFMITATLAFLLSAVWSVLMLLMSGLMLDKELHAFLKHTGLLELLPLFLFLVGIIFVALGLFWWLWIILFEQQWPYLAAAYTCLLSLALQSLYTFASSVRGLFATRREYLDSDEIVLTAAEVRLRMEDYARRAGEKMDPQGFRAYLCHDDRSMGDRSMRHITFLTDQRVQRVFDDFVKERLETEQHSQ